MSSELHSSFQTPFKAACKICLTQCRVSNSLPLLAAGEDIVMASGKLEVLDRLLAKLKAKGHRVVLFCQWNKTLDIIEDFLIMRRYRWAFIFQACERHAINNTEVLPHMLLLQCVLQE